MHVTAALATLLTGLVLVLATGMSVLRSLVSSDERPGRMELGLVRAAVWSLSAAETRLGRRPTVWLSRGAGPTVLAALLTCWLIAFSTGGLLVAEAAAGLSDLDGPLRALATGNGAVGSARTVISLTWLADGITAALWVALVAQVADAHRSRERLAARVGTLARGDMDAEEVIALHGRSGGAGSLGPMLDDWGGAMTDLMRSHATHPVLLIMPISRRTPCWIRALAIALDVAALLDAALPATAPPRTRAILRAGCETAQSLVRTLGVPVRPVDASLHGREGRTFDQTVSIIRGSGLPVRSDLAAVYRDFQQWRLGYGPHLTALAVQLRSEKPIAPTSQYSHAAPLAGAGAVR